MFDSISKDDIIIAFFPCTRFEARIPLGFRGEMTQQKNWSTIQKLEYAMELHTELDELYHLISMMVIICLRKKLRIVIENPYTQPHYLTQYWALKPSLIDKDRTDDGDYYKKPTQFWFINCSPEQNFVFEPIDYVKTQAIHKVKTRDGLSVKTLRSMIHPQYANRFIRKYIIDYEQKF